MRLTLSRWPVALFIFSKKQATVEVATYSSEMVAMRTCVEHFIDLRMTLRYLGVPIREKSFMFGDNESVAKSATQVCAKLHERHNMLSFHFVREAVAARYVHITHTPGSIKPLIFSASIGDTRMCGRSSSRCSSIKVTRWTVDDILHLHEGE
jgi:hypothetical protein